MNRSFLWDLFPCSIAVITKLRAFYSIQILLEAKQSSWLCLMKLRVSSSLNRSFLRNLFPYSVAVNIKAPCFAFYTSHSWDETIFMTTLDETLNHFYGIYIPCFVAVINKKLHDLHSIQVLLETRQSLWLYLMKLWAFSHTAIQEISLNRLFLQNLFSLSRHSKIHIHACASSQSLKSTFIDDHHRSIMTPQRMLAVYKTLTRFTIVNCLPESSISTTRRCLQSYTLSTMTWAMSNW